MGTELAVDGLTNSAWAQAAGYQSPAHPGPDAPVTLTLDLKEARTFDQVVLYPRADVLTDDGRVPGFPVDYALSTADTADGPYATAARVTGQRPPTPYLPSGLPLFSKDFTLPGRPLGPAPRGGPRRVRRAAQRQAGRRRRPRNQPTPTSPTASSTPRTT